MELKEELKKFIDWTKLKIRLHVKEKEELYFKEREIWWASLGQNIGFEQDGKHENFERPVLILKVFNGEVLWILPMTSQEKKGEYYLSVKYEEKIFSVILSQLRLISSRRLLRKIRTISEDEFNAIKDRVKKFL